MQSSEQGLTNLKEVVDTLILIPNDRLLQIIDKNTSLQDSFRMADKNTAPGHPGHFGIDHRSWPDQPGLL